MINIKELEEKLKNIAEDIGVRIGCPTEMRHSVTGEEYLELGIQFKEEDIEDLLSKWKDSIISMKVVSTLRFFRKYRNIKDIGKITLYWRIKPEVKKHPDGNLYSFYARVLISCHKEKYYEDRVLVAK
ncbi:hypothetical protein LCGC14_2835650 [marine sediment metagenome]|uniref:Uncharacterized protein n=1 Tax=marine sediment metagenome TaxID=412755 RepID=A0A0F9AL48_9ZZZZ